MRRHAIAQVTQHVSTYVSLVLPCCGDGHPKFARTSCHYASSLPGDSYLGKVRLIMTHSGSSHQQRVWVYDVDDGHG